MAKPKARTLQQRFGFVDGDLMKPEHDEIMLWLDERAEGICTTLFDTANYPIKIDWEEVAKKKDEVQDKIQYYLDTLASYSWFENWTGLEDPVTPEQAMVKTKWEYAITTEKTKYTIGFVDMVATLCFNPSPYLRCYFQSYPPFCNDEPPSWRWAYSHVSFCFEVKTEIKSLGELIRQIRMYQEHIDSPFYIVTPDCRFASPLESQGIGTIHYPSGKIVGRA